MGPGKERPMPKNIFGRIFVRIIQTLFYLIIAAVFLWTGLELIVDFMG